MENGFGTLNNFLNYIDEVLCKRIQELYLADKIPWVIGYSGGKDSTACVQLIWNAIAGLEPEQRNHKTVSIISTNTMVESPVVEKWVAGSLKKMEEAALAQNMPFDINRLKPDITDSFWVLLIGKGYPAPRPNFRWCTDRLKIKPADKFITSTIAKHGEVILILGTRLAESSKRAHLMKQYEQKRVREYLSPTKRLINCSSFTPIEDWSDHDVWAFLLNRNNPWGQANFDLLEIYEGATADGECPLVIDTNTPSCGNSRFGCWVCTMVQEDRSMQAMINNNPEKKEWLKPLLELRNEIGKFPDREKRDYRRMSGQILLHNDRAVPGPYIKKWREYWLRSLLTIEQKIMLECPEDYKELRLITDEELRLIRRIWVLEKHEFDDALPLIYKEVTGKKYPYLNDISTVFGRDEWNLLKDICGEDDTLFELQTILIDITQRHYGLRRQGVMSEIDEAIRRCYYEDEEDAVRMAQTKKDELDRAMEANLEVLLAQGVELK